MKYQSGGYSWLGVAPESDEELKIEKLEDKIHELKKAYHQKKDPEILNHIKQLEDQLENKQK